MSPAPSGLPPPSRSSTAGDDEVDFARNRAILAASAARADGGATPPSGSSVASKPKMNAIGVDDDDEDDGEAGPSGPPRKRLRRAGDRVAESPAPVSSPHSHITTPEDRSHLSGGSKARDVSSPQVITSPPDHPSPYFSAPSTTEKSASFREKIQAYKMAQPAASQAQRPASVSRTSSHDSQVAALNWSDLPKPTPQPYVPGQPSLLGTPAGPSRTPSFSPPLAHHPNIKMSGPSLKVLKSVFGPEFTNRFVEDKYVELGGDGAATESFLKRERGRRRKPTSATLPPQQSPASRPPQPSNPYAFTPRQPPVTVHTVKQPQVNVLSRPKPPPPVQVKQQPRVTATPRSTNGSASSSARPSPAPPAASQSSPPVVVAKPSKRRRAIYSSDEEDTFSDGGDDAYDTGGITTAEQERIEAQTLKFFNDAQPNEIAELTGCSQVAAASIVKNRPYDSLDDARTKARKQKGVPNSVVDNYIELCEGMATVDTILTDCERTGSELSQIMRIWATHGTGGSGANSTATSRSATPDVGLNLVNIAASESAPAQQMMTEEERSAFKNFLYRQPEDMPANVKLKDYQMLGLNWLNMLYRRNTSAILADEMGLGKTAQVIALLVHLKATKQPSPHLVIVPSSTLENWLREFKVFGPSLNVQSYYGSQMERAEIRHEVSRMDDVDVIVTTYNIATSSVDDHRFLRKRMQFNVIVFDEGHQLKNSQSKKHKDLMQIGARWRLLLTGTPLQNNLQELVSLLSFILPEHFRNSDDALRAIFKVAPDAATHLLARERVTRAKKMMTPFVLRRKKAQVLKDLPNKYERIEWCDMTELQREVYVDALGRSRKALMALDEGQLEAAATAENGGDDGDAPKKAGRKKKAPKRTEGASGANVLMDLRKASNHPMLFRRLYKDSQLRPMALDCLKEDDFYDSKLDYVIEDMEVMTDFELHRLCSQYKHLKKYMLQHDEWMSAGKVHKLQELLPRLKENGDRVLLFSQFTQVLDILEVVLDTMGIRWLKLTGSTNVTDRQGLVDEYNEDPDITVFLLSTRAGGLGLNLTAANTVIIHDQDFNPHNDKQAEDRAFRIGQVRDVNVIRFITRESVEEDMRNLAETKLRLDDTVSSTSQYPSGVAPPNAAADEEEASGQQVERKMRTSLLMNLKKRWEGEVSASQMSAATKVASSPAKPAVPAIAEE